MPDLSGNVRFGVTGEVQGAGSTAILPSVACLWVNIKACHDNTGKVYIGRSSVTKADGTTDTTTGWPLAAGEETGWLPCLNVNEFYRICDNATDDLVYMTML